MHESCFQLQRHTREREGAIMFGFPKKNAKKRTPKVRPQLEALENREVMSFTPHGGPVMTHVQAESVYYGQDWTTNANRNTASQLETRRGQLTLPLHQGGNVPCPPPVPFFPSGWQLVRKQSRRYGAWYASSMFAVLPLVPDPESVLLMMLASVKASSATAALAMST
jgi:hypothetical protein